ncbi:hypothetical protein B0H17DRAFT_1186658 [Mycena rosella]|uniref:Uncharacterized protein n=1 Tax=Mycena rosella TaxID=1033263 RepID=A0AAD7G156_MYCRO|nr:hypothetical protein B0H17DRAFT_1186658 [Mycena rosella]
MSKEKLLRKELFDGAVHRTRYWPRQWPRNSGRTRRRKMEADGRNEERRRKREEGRERRGRLEEVRAGTDTRVTDWGPAPKNAHNPGTMHLRPGAARSVLVLTRKMRPQQARREQRTANRIGAARAPACTEGEDKRWRGSNAGRWCWRPRANHVESHRPAIPGGFAVVKRRRMGRTQGRITSVAWIGAAIIRKTGESARSHARTPSAAQRRSRGARTESGTSHNYVEQLGRGACIVMRKRPLRREPERARRALELHHRAGGAVRWRAATTEAARFTRHQTPGAARSVLVPTRKMRPQQARREQRTANRIGTARAPACAEGEDKSVKRRRMGRTQGRITSVAWIGAAVNRNTGKSARSHARTPSAAQRRSRGARTESGASHNYVEQLGRGACVVMRKRPLRREPERARRALELHHRAGGAVRWRRRRKPPASLDTRRKYKALIRTKTPHKPQLFLFVIPMKREERECALREMKRKGAAQRRWRHEGLARWSSGSMQADNTSARSEGK